MCGGILQRGRTEEEEVQEVGGTNGLERTKDKVRCLDLTLSAWEDFGVLQQGVIPSDFNF